MRQMAPVMNESTRRFILAHAGDDVRQLALRGCKDPEVDLPFALDQIAGRQTAKMKLPSWAAVDGIVYPPHLSMEQCSSELTARYKSGVAGKGRLLVDLTGGFGVDFTFMARQFEQAVYVERQPLLCAISSENLATLGLAHTQVVCADATDYLRTMDTADLIFIDPARRDAHGSRTYGIADCTPNVLELMPELTARSSRLMLKLSPMLDWQKAVADIGRERVEAVHIVSVDNECKELLLIVNREKRSVVDEEGSLRVVCVNLSQDGTEEYFAFHPNSLAHPSAPTIHYPLSTVHYLYEPNASLMKAGCFDEIAGRYGISQLDSNSHLFVSETEVIDFPGRRFRIDGFTTMNKRDLKAALAGIDRANITVRNFPVSVADLRKRLRLKDGGDVYIFATTVAGAGHQLYICRKIG